MLNKILRTYGSTLKDIFVSNEDYYNLYDDIIPRKLSSVYNRTTLIEAADIYKYLKHGIEFDGMKNWTPLSKVFKSTLRVKDLLDDNIDWTEKLNISIASIYCIWKCSSSRRR